MIMLCCSLINDYVLLQLLEVTASGIKLALEWGQHGMTVADGLSNLLKVTIELKTQLIIALYLNKFIKGHSNS